MTTNIPEIADLTPEQLLSLRKTIDARLDAIKATYIEQCAAVGLTCTDGNGKPRKPRASKQESAD